MAHEDGVVTAAPFPPPHAGMAEALPEALVVTVLPHRTSLYETSSATSVSLSNGTWTVSNKRAFPNEVIFYISKELPISIVGSYTNLAELSSADRKTIEQFCTSIAADGGETP
ncbi:hypothetical protein [Sorangium sp. So ce394]|uniref:hypothetical protein n=1 Tax=Sorangium sp. So ce394 TaxID=3133310 RepID=UPI003F5C7131